MEYYELFIISVLSLVFYCYFLRQKNGFPTFWPLIGMLPSILVNVSRIHDFLTQLLEKSDLTFFFKGTWLITNLNTLVTVDPTNVHYVMSKNFGNYPKGSKFKERLDILGDSISTTDFQAWQYHRKMAQSFLGHPKFNQFLVKKTWEKVENGLIPLLDHVSMNNDIEIDLQDLFSRFTFDTICIIIMDHDPKSLSIELPSAPSSKALDVVEEVIFYRHVVPTWVWKLQRWLNVGKEKEYSKAWKILDSYIYKCISLRRKEMSEGQNLSKKKKEGEQSVDLLTLYIEENESNNVNDLSGDHSRDKFLRDMILSKFIAGRDTISTALSWFFYLVINNPQVLSKVKKELNEVKVTKSNFKEVNSKLVYLHAALSETLRLYPPIAFESKSPIEPDRLPSGHNVNPGMQILFNLYVMGRMKSIWGDDCNEFRPERWISEQGEFRNEPSYKFMTFNSGPRTCLGKDMAFTQMKIVVATILQNYVIQAVEEQHVVPDMKSIILHMKYGYKVKLSRLE